MGFIVFGMGANVGLGELGTGAIVVGSGVLGMGANVGLGVLGMGAGAAVGFAVVGCWVVVVLPVLVSTSCGSLLLYWYPGKSPGSMQ